jgi:hypothetical protein
MRRLAWTTVAVALMLMCGCRRDKEAARALHERAAELIAAAEISDANARDAALAKIARQAAMAGDVKAVNMALGKIGDRKLFNSTAGTAALALLELNMQAAAKEVAGLMDEGPERNDVLAILAKG